MTTNHPSHSPDKPACPACGPSDDEDDFILDDFTGEVTFNTEATCWQYEVAFDCSRCAQTHYAWLSFLDQSRDVVNPHIPEEPDYAHP